MEDVVTGTVIRTVGGFWVCVSAWVGGMYLEVNGVDDVFVRLSKSQSHITHCSEMCTGNTGVGHRTKLV